MPIDDPLPPAEGLIDATSNWGRAAGACACATSARPRPAAAIHAAAVRTCTPAYAPSFGPRVQRDALGQLAASGRKHNPSSAYTHTGAQQDARTSRRHSDSSPRRTAATPVQRTSRKRVHSPDMRQARPCSNPDFAGKMGVRFWKSHEAGRCPIHAPRAQITARWDSCLAERPKRTGCSKPAFPWVPWSLRRSLSGLPEVT